jgi:hypothetical protein
LEFPVSAKESRLYDLLDFPFGFAIDDLRCGAFVVRTVRISFMVAGQEVNMEYRVDFHGRGEHEAISDGG